MLTKYALPLLAAGGLAFAIYSVVQARQGPPPSVPLIRRRRPRSSDRSPAPG